MDLVSASPHIHELQVLFFDEEKPCSLPVEYGVHEHFAKGGDNCPPNLRLAESWPVHWTRHCISSDVSVQSVDGGGRCVHRPKERLQLPDEREDRIG